MFRTRNRCANCSPPRATPFPYPSSPSPELTSGLDRNPRGTTDTPAGDRSRRVLLAEGAEEDVGIRGRRIRRRPSAPRARRSRKSGPARAAAELGLVAADELDTAHPAAPDPREEEIRATVRSGNWQAGADFLAEAGRDWQERYRRAGVLQDEAAADDTWLLAWRTAQPKDAGAAFVHAGALISVAADIRGAKQAKYTTQEQFAGFHRMMAQAREACHEAQELAGDDPCPYIAEISCALGLGYGHDDFRTLWAEIEKRDAHHLAAHTSALQYWCRKWRGSHELAEHFAREAAQKGSPGRLLSSSRSTPRSSRSRRSRIWTRTCSTRAPS